MNAKSSVGTLQVAMLPATDEIGNSVLPFCLAEVTFLTGYEYDRQAAVKGTLTSQS
jgi:hypothetical protein